MTRKEKYIHLEEILKCFAEEKGLKVTFYSCADPDDDVEKIVFDFVRTKPYGKVTKIYNIKIREDSGMVFEILQLIGTIEVINEFYNDEKSDPHKYELKPCPFCGEKLRLDDTRRAVLEFFNNRADKNSIKKDDSMERQMRLNEIELDKLSKETGKSKDIILEGALKLYRHVYEFKSE